MNKDVYNNSFGKEIIDGLWGYVEIMPNEFGLPTTIFVDVNVSFDYYHHQPCLYVVNGYTADYSELIPISIEESPKVIFEPKELLLRSSDMDEVLQFVAINSEILSALAKEELDYSVFYKQVRMIGKELLPPKPIYNEYDGIKVISIYDRGLSEKISIVLPNEGNETPLLHSKLLFLLDDFITETPELQNGFDTIIVTHTLNKLNNAYMKRLLKLIYSPIKIDAWFLKCPAIDVYEHLLYGKWFDEHPEINHSQLLNEIMEMGKHNNGLFSYKFIKSLEIRQAISKAMYVCEYFKTELEYADEINGKNVLILDDTIECGEMVSYSADAIMRMFDTKSITVITLFSPNK